MSSDTKITILIAAEKLFANQGFAETSMRAIVAEAEVNLAAVNYHFGSKEGLIREVLERRMKPLEQERLQLLDACEAKAGDAETLPLEEVLDALIRPALWLSNDPELGGEVFMRLLGRTFTEPNEALQLILNEQLSETLRRFIPALQRALPELNRGDLFWRLHFSVGAMAHTMCDAKRLTQFSGGLCEADDVDQQVRQLIAYTAAGMRAESVSNTKEADE